MKCLVVEDDRVLGKALVRTLEDWGAAVEYAATVGDGLALLQHAPQLVIFDIVLPDGSGVAVAETAARQLPVPLMVAISGQGSGAQGFELARLGVLGYLAKPLSLTDFTSTIERVLSRAPEMVPMLVAAVGRQPFQDVLCRIKKAMVEQALALSGGNKTKAARLLGVTRQAVQQQIRDLGVAVATFEPSAVKVQLKNQ